MKLLLDTHVFLWFISGDERLPEAMQELLPLAGSLPNLLPPFAQRPRLGLSTVVGNLLLW